MIIKNNSLAISTFFGTETASGRETIKGTGQIFYWLREKSKLACLYSRFLSLETGIKV
jgi:hypothetical protein